MVEEETYLISSLGESQTTAKEEGKEENFFSSPKGKIITAIVAVVVKSIKVIPGRAA